MNNKYISQTTKYLREGKQALKKGNYQQASEKYWGAAASIVKVYAENKGIQHDGHKKLFRIVSDLVEKTHDEELGRLFSRAGMLHINFYENWLPKREVSRSIRDTEKFIKKMEMIINQTYNANI